MKDVNTNINYPLISEYIDAILNAEDNFDTLCDLRPVLGEDGRPFMSSGNFAVVFKMRDITTGKEYAIKCFLKEQIGRAETYTKISKDFERFRIGFNYFVIPEYLENELYVDSINTPKTEFPILKMEWIDGMGLLDYMQSISDNQHLRRRLVNNFRDLICYLLPTHYAHGDLKPDNIIVKPNGEIILIDYDGMYVPSMYGEKAHEIGTPPFQFKGRTASDFNEYIDDYAGVLLLLVLELYAQNAFDVEELLQLAPQEIIKRASLYCMDKNVASYLSAYILVSTFGYLYRDCLNSLLADNSNYDINAENELIHEATKGNVVAMEQLGHLYQSGYRTPKNIAKGYMWFDVASKLGLVSASCGKCKGLFWGFGYDYGDNPIQKLLVERNINEALCRKAENIIHKDREEAMRLWTIAHEQGYIPATNSLAVYTKEAEAKIKLYQMAAEKGDSSAQRTLGKFYRDGKNVEKDINKAIEWFRRAVENGDGDSALQLGAIFYNGNSMLDVDYKKAVVWYEKAADLGNADALFMLGYCYMYGKGVTANYKTAVEYWKDGVRKQNRQSTFYLAMCYEQGVGVNQDFSLAVKYYTEATHRVYSDAEYFLERCCRMHNINDETTVLPDEIIYVGECNTGTYSQDGRRFLAYWGTYGDTYTVREGTEVLCDDSFNDLYSECDRHYLQTLKLPESLIRIGNNVFCASITNIECDSCHFEVEDGFLLSKNKRTLYRYFGNETIIRIPDGVKYIKGGAFSEKGIIKVIIPESTIWIGDNPFAGCHDLVEVESNSSRIQIKGKTLYDLTEKRLIGCWDYQESHYYIQNGTKIIGKNAFFGCDFHYIEIPDSIEEIDETAFYWCFKLCNISIPSCQYAKIYNMIPSYVRKFVLEDNDLPF